MPAFAAELLPEGKGRWREPFLTLPYPNPNPKLHLPSPQGTSLWLLGTSLDDACCRVLAERLRLEQWAHLTCLHLGRNRFGAAGLTAVSRAIGSGAAHGAASGSGGLRRLEQLSIESNGRVGDEGICALASAPQPHMVHCHSAHTSH